MNNKKVFSLNMFVQTYKQLKAVGITASIVLAVFNIFPVLVYVLDIETMKRAYADNPRMLASISKVVINVVEQHGAMTLLFMVFTPIFALNVWKFLNKRSTSDFYHSLPYTRVCLFISKSCAVLTWIVEIVAICLAGTALTYLIFSKYFVVDFGSLVSMFVSVLIASFLVFAAISMACALTGNAFNNVMVTGMILFLPRFMIFFVTDAVANMAYVVKSENAISFLNNTQNIVATYVLNAFSYNADSYSLLLSGQAKIYTLVLGVIYMSIALWLFATRKSECAGRATNSKAFGFVLKFVICVVVTCFGTVTAVVNMRTASTDSEKVMCLYAAFSVFVISALVVLLYEFFANRHFFKFKSCILPTVAGWAAAVVIAVLTNVGADAVLSYRPDESDMEYVVISKYDEYNFYQEYEDYFEAVAKNTHIDNAVIKKMVSEALKNNLNKVEDDSYDDFYRYSHYDGDKDDDREGYVQYQVFIKDGLLGKYRTIYLTKAQEKVFVDNIQKVEAYREAYYDLPQFKDVSLEVYCENELSKLETEKIYDAYIKELSSMDFATYYKSLNQEQWSYLSFNMEATFTRGGSMYIAELYVCKEYFPQTYQTYVNVTNEYINTELTNVKNTSIKVLEKLMNSGADVELNSKDKELYVQITDTKGRVGHIDSYQMLQDDELKKVFVPEVVAQMKSGSGCDINKKDGFIVTVSYYENSDWMNFIHMTYYINVNADVDLSDYLSEY